MLGNSYTHCGHEDQYVAFMYKMYGDVCISYGYETVLK
jgi:hypothetical protein